MRRTKQWPAFLGLGALVACNGGALGVGAGSFSEGSCVFSEIDPQPGSIEVELAAQLGGEGDEPGLLTGGYGTLNPARDRLGRYWIGQGGELAIFESDGTYAATVGREGEGPLEFLMAIPFHVDSAGRVHVVDVDAQRISVVGEDFELAGQTALSTFTYEVEALAGGRYAFSGWIPSGDNAGFPVHVAEDGEVTASLGAVQSEPSAGPLEAMLAQRTILATDGAGNIFTAPDRDYVVSAWSQNGQRIGRFEGPAFGNGPLRGGWSDDNPPSHHVRDIQVDAEGRVWLLLEYRRADWRDGVIEQTRPNGDLDLRLADGPQRVYRFRMDVVDPSACRMVASQWLDHADMFGEFVVGGDGIAVSELVHGEAGDPLVTIWNMTLAR